MNGSIRALLFKYELRNIVRIEVTLALIDDLRKVIEQIAQAARKSALDIRRWNLVSAVSDPFRHPQPRDITIGQSEINVTANVKLTH